MNMTITRMARRPRSTIDDTIMTRSATIRRRCRAETHAETPVAAVVEASVAATSEEPLPTLHDELAHDERTHEEQAQENVAHADDAHRTRL